MASILSFILFFSVRLELDPEVVSGPWFEEVSDRSLPPSEGVGLGPPPPSLIGCLRATWSSSLLGESAGPSSSLVDSFPLVLESGPLCLDLFDFTSFELRLAMDAPSLACLKGESVRFSRQSQIS